MKLPDATPILGAASLAPTMVSYAGITISFIEFNPDGSDVAGEFVRIANGDNAAVDLTGCTLRDHDSRHVYTFPSFTLAPGAEVQLWTKAGDDDETNLYWGMRSAVWNNEGDTAVLADPEGAEITSYTYEGNS